jgi:hypothetical protein
MILSFWVFMRLTYLPPPSLPLLCVERKAKIAPSEKITPSLLLDVQSSLPREIAKAFRSFQRKILAGNRMNREEIEALKAMVEASPALRFYVEVRCALLENQCV